ncbi:MAG: class I tRNA ligase family protein, partial [Candidatus Nanopelagicus sp.]
ICVGSLAELCELSGQQVSKLDPHRPFVDEINFPCAKCSKMMSRTPEVIDCWYDSGAMPFAQWGYPHQAGSVEKFKAAHPADFICEAIDQTRGWFYTLMTIGTLVFDQSPYKTVLCLGHILDKDGRKMSKHLGNVLEPMPLMNQHGADAVRWYMLAAGSPWSARRVGHDAISDVVRKTLLTYWNTISFFTLYANAAEFSVSNLPKDLTLMDKWIISELNNLILGVDAALEDFDSQQAGLLLSSFIDDLSNWYVRRSRRRFWDGDPVALNTLYFCLKNLTLLLAPMVPFISEHVWQSLIRVAEADQVDSVHLASFPDANKNSIDDQLSRAVALSRRLVELGRSARAESGVKIRQPLSRALVSAPGWDEISQEIKDHISEELNILKLDGIALAQGDLVDVYVKANFRSLGNKFGADVQAIAKAISTTNHGQLVKELRKHKTIKLPVKISSGDSAEIDIEDLVITETPRSGWSVAAHGGESLALDLTLTPELIQSGLVREVIRAIQEERKRIGLDVSDRITVNWNATDQTAAAITSAIDDIGTEVLATKFNRMSNEGKFDNDLGLWLNLEKN